MAAPLVTRKWFQDKDGTYFRNCPLILGEQRELLDRLKTTSPWRVRRIHKLSRALDELLREWNAVWCSSGLGIVRKDTLDPGDVVVPRGRFRDVYPDKPGLWVLDDRT